MLLWMVSGSLSKEVAFELSKCQGAAFQRPEDLRRVCSRNLEWSREGSVIGDGKEGRGQITLGLRTLS